MTFVRITHLKYAAPEQFVEFKAHVGSELYATAEQPVYAVLHYPIDDNPNTATILAGGTALCQDRIAQYGPDDWMLETDVDRFDIIRDDDPTVPPEAWAALARYRLTQ